MANILVTGANGFIGQHLGMYLQEQGHDVVAAVRHARCRINYSPTKVITVGTIDGASQWSPGLEGVDVIVHLAARVHVMQDQAADPLTAFRQVNTAGTLRLAEQAVVAGVKRNKACWS